MLTKQMLIRIIDNCVLTLLVCYVLERKDKQKLTEQKIDLELVNHFAASS